MDDNSLVERSISIPGPIWFDLSEIGMLLPPRLPDQVRVQHVLAQLVERQLELVGAGSEQALAAFSAAPGRKGPAPGHLDAKAWSDSGHTLRAPLRRAYDEAFVEFAAERGISRGEAGLRLALAAISTMCGGADMLGRLQELRVGSPWGSAPFSLERRERAHAALRSFCSMDKAFRAPGRAGAFRAAREARAIAAAIPQAPEPFSARPAPRL